ncbi:MAG TPA: PaaI family thioesterase [Drouetiella sp.]
MSIQTVNRKPLKCLDPNFEQKVRDSFSHQGVMQVFNGELKHVGLGTVEVHVPFAKGLAQQHGFFHGGMVAMVADTASGFATYTVISPEEECLSAEFKINFLAPANGEKLIGRGSIIKVGRTLVVAEATVSVLRDGQEIECAFMLHTLARTRHVKSGQSNMPTANA